MRLWDFTSPLAATQLLLVERVSNMSCELEFRAMMILGFAVLMIQHLSTFIMGKFPLSLSSFYFIFWYTTCPSFFFPLV